VTASGVKHAPAVGRVGDCFRCPAWSELVIASATLRSREFELSGRKGAIAFAHKRARARAPIQALAVACCVGKR